MIKKISTYDQYVLLPHKIIECMNRDYKGQQLAGCDIEIPHFLFNFF